MLNGRRRSGCCHRNGWLCPPRDRCSPQSQRYQRGTPAQRAIAVAISSIGTELPTSALQRFRPDSEGQLTFGGRDPEDRSCEGFRMPARDEWCGTRRGPVSESLQGRNPREVGCEGAAGAMGIWARRLG